jgi:hypothetical protein
MSANEGYIYTVVILRIYETGGPISDTPRALSRRTGMRLDFVNKALGGLVKMGKITIVDGVIDCEKTKERLHEMVMVQRKRIVTGKCSAAIRWGKHQLNQGNGVTGAEHLNNTRIHNKIKKDNKIGTSSVPEEEGLARLREPLEVSASLRDVLAKKGIH